MTTWATVMNSVMVKLRPSAGPRLPPIPPLVPDGGPEGDDHAGGDGHAREDGEHDRRFQSGRRVAKPTNWVAASTTMAGSHHHGVAVERSAEDCQIWPANTAIATTPLTTAKRRRGDASGAGWLSRPPAARAGSTPARTPPPASAPRPRTAAVQPALVLPVDGHRVERLAGVEVGERRRQRLDEGEPDRDQHQRRQHDQRRVLPDEAEGAPARRLADGGGREPALGRPQDPVAQACRPPPPGSARPRRRRRQRA